MLLFPSSLRRWSFSHFTNIPAKIYLILYSHPPSKSYLPSTSQSWRLYQRTVQFSSTQCLFVSTFEEKHTTCLLEMIFICTPTERIRESEICKLEDLREDFLQIHYTYAFLLITKRLITQSKLSGLLKVTAN